MVFVLRFIIDVTVLIQMCSNHLDVHRHHLDSIQYSVCLRIRMALIVLKRYEEII